MRTFRLIEFQGHDGATNMAVDEAMLESCIAGSTPPTLRLYNFRPPAVSLGYAQSLSEQQIEHIVASGFDVVQRPTGGRAVLHYKELTYCFVGTTSGEGGCEERLLSPSVGQAYKQICQGLIIAMLRLGAPLEVGSAKSGQRQPHDCFLATTAADLHCQGKKMVGSAQLRRKSGVLQHGSILLEQEQTLMEQLLSSLPVSVDEIAKDDSVGSHHANLFDVLGKEVSIDTLQKYIVEGFEEAFSCKLEPGNLTQEERAMVERLKPKFHMATAACV